MIFLDIICFNRNKGEWDEETELRQVQHDGKGAKVIKTGCYLYLYVRQKLQKMITVVISIMFHESLLKVYAIILFSLEFISESVDSIKDAIYVLQLQQSDSVLYYDAMVVGGINPL